MNELTGLTIAALHDERWVRERSDPSRRHRRHSRRRGTLDVTGRDGREATKAPWWHRAPR